MKVLVIGGGAAGILSAISAAQMGNEVTLIEQNEKLGKKIFITGKGRCNVTNACSKDDLMKSVVRNPKFLYSAFGSFDNDDIRSLIEEEGCELKVERGNRVFPVSDHSSDVIHALEKKLRKLNVEIKLYTRIKDLIVEENKCIGVLTDKNQKIFGEHVVLATGGASYSTTGSDGAILKLMEKYGHSIIPLRPALVPLNCLDEWVISLQGLALKNVEFRLMDGNKCKYKEQGEMLFTHFGLSGPIVLSASSYYENGYEGFIDLKPALSLEKLDERLLRDFSENNNKNFENACSGLFPNRLISVMISLSGIDPYKKVHQITKEERLSFGYLMKNLPVHISGTRGFNEAIITRGGISVKDIDPSSMKSKHIEGLSFAGEMIDLDALTGGYNLQIAWSTGYLAGLGIYY